MKKIIAAVALISMIFISGCNRDMVDTVLSYDKAIVKLADWTVVKGKVESWRDYEDGEQVQIKIDGTIYLVHIANVSLIKDDEKWKWKIKWSKLVKK